MQYLQVDKTSINTLIEILEHTQQWHSEIGNQLNFVQLQLQQMLNTEDNNFMDEDPIDQGVMHLQGIQIPENEQATIKVTLLNGQYVRDNTLGVIKGNLAYFNIAPLSIEDIDKVYIGHSKEEQLAEYKTKKKNQHEIAVSIPKQFYSTDLEIRSGGHNSPLIKFYVRVISVDNRYGLSQEFYIFHNSTSRKAYLDK